MGTFARLIEKFAEQALIYRGYALLFSNMSFAGVEVDRVFQDRDGDWVLCEIKTIRDWRYLDVRVRFFQKKRLNLARRWLEAYRAPGPVQIHYVYVHYFSGEVRVYSEGGDELEVITELLRKW